MEQNNTQPSFAKASDGQRQINIKATDEKLKGEYSNVMQIMHTKEEFLLDFLNVFPPTGTLNSRIIVSPGHFKRMVKAVQENLTKYESTFGKIADPKHLRQSASKHNVITPGLKKLIESDALKLNQNAYP